QLEHDVRLRAARTIGRGGSRRDPGIPATGIAVLDSPSRCAEHPRRAGCASALDAGEGREPVRLPGPSLVGGERLLEAERVTGELGDDEAHADGISVARL